MLLDKLVPVLGTPIRIGVLMESSGDGTKIPFFLIDFGKEYPSIEPLIARNGTMTLDIVPDGDHCTFHVTGDRMVSELTPELLNRALAAPPETRNQVLFGQGRPEFASSVTLSGESCEQFIEAFTAGGGFWLLVTLSHSGTRSVIAPDGEIIRTESCSRLELEYLLG